MRETDTKRLKKLSNFAKLQFSNEKIYSYTKSHLTADYLVNFVIQEMKFCQIAQLFFASFYLVKIDKIFFHKIPALGMNHDFGIAHGGTNDQYTAKNACNYQGFMSYGDHKSEWSECSVKDFTAWYNRNKEKWCMPGKTC